MDKLHTEKIKKETKKKNLVIGLFAVIIALNILAYWNDIRLIRYLAILYGAGMITILYIVNILTRKETKNKKEDKYINLIDLTDKVK